MNAPAAKRRFGRPATTSAAIEEALWAAGERGLTPAECAAAANTTPRTVKQTICRFRNAGWQIASVRSGHGGAARYWARAEWKVVPPRPAAEFCASGAPKQRELQHLAKVARMEARLQEKQRLAAERAAARATERAQSKRGRARAMLMAAGPAGVPAEQLRTIAPGITASIVTARIAWSRVEGPGRRRRYFGTAEWAAAYVKPAPAPKPKPLPKPPKPKAQAAPKPKAPPRPKPAPAPRPAPKKPAKKCAVLEPRRVEPPVMVRVAKPPKPVIPAEVIVPANVKRTVAPPAPDRWALTAVPFFSAMTPGSYLRNDSAISRAYR